MSDTARPLKAQTILAQVANLHVLTENLLASIDSIDRDLRELALANVAQAINNGETAIPAISIELFAKADTLPELRAASEGMKAQIETTLSAGSEKSSLLLMPVDSAQARPAARPRLPLESVTAELDAALGA